jgi:L-fuconolactonase
MTRGLVDSHQHVWKVGLFDYPWMSPALGVLYRDYLVGDLAAVLSSSRVDHSILVQASNSLAETRWMLELADANPFVLGVVGWVDLASPRVADQLDELQAHPKFRGVRHLVESEADDGWLVRPAVLDGLRELARRGVPYDLLVHTRHLKHVPRVADACPDLRLVVDHLAKPPIASGAFDEWARAIEGVAAIATVHCKLSGLVTEADHANWRREDLVPYVEHALSCFGSRRLLFGSDYPVCLLAASYEAVVESFRGVLAGLDDDARAGVFGDNAVRFYRL